MMNVRETRAGAADVQQWVLGAPYTSTVDRSVPGGVLAGELSQYCAMLGDDALVLAHRLTEWGVRALELEECAALGRIALDLVEQARVLLRRAGEVEGAGRDEDRLAYARQAADFHNVRLVEIDCGPGPGGDFPTTMARLLLFAAWRHAVFERLAGSRDAVLADLAAGSLNRLARHRDHAAQWVIRFGDGDADSARRMAAGLQRIWPLTAELFVPHPVEARMDDLGCGVDPARVRDEVRGVLDEVSSVARIRLPEPPDFGVFARPGGRDGAHTGDFEFLIADLQYLARSG
ncbi:ring-1,2-phenylacetyl-CoA epoxidase subunit PaaC [Saccharopolyspora antimicrobica]|uniref:Ring-1,2-phenylacetyl-CoA epoxidase subunit PaaC n=2 Tax=Saccharopolyspora antimicrobica TaxID=455193 RepID=A0A1I5DVJ1_9PSEU|nr:ring-1,2-phenylacetyl-CoA epoxidase subunit PaaC [Saccharopolyspora antimicrobica]SFO03207.1 ring-1,2-phenylacetyl-CoA epoxidase subunit PaaC [Saccharopolyspora antimicrobica]